MLVSRLSEQPAIRPKSLDKLRAAGRSLPRTPGIYMYADEYGQTIYVGKAVDLRRRVCSYFTPSSLRDRKISRLVNCIDSIYYAETTTELEALLLESRVIKNRFPAFNRKLREPETYCYIRIDERQQLPSMRVVFHDDGDGASYLGPFWHSAPVIESVEALNRAFRLRQCDGPLIPGSRRNPCVYHGLDRCSGPCANPGSAHDYQKRLLDAVDSLIGDSDAGARLLAKRRDELSEDLRFEEACRIQHQVKSLKQVSSMRIILPSELRDRYVLVVPSFLPKRPMLLFWSDGRLAHRVLAGPRSYPGRRVVLDALRRIGDQGHRDILPGRWTTDDMLIIHSYLLSHGARSRLIPCPPDGQPEHIADEILSVVDSLRRDGIDQT